MLIELAVLDDQAVDEGSGRVGGEIKRVAAIQERVEQELDSIVGVEVGVSRHLSADHEVRLQVLADRAHVQVFAVVQQLDLGPLGRRLALARLPLRELTD